MSSPNRSKVFLVNFNITAYQTFAPKGMQHGHNFPFSSLNKVRDSGPAVMRKQNILSIYYVQNIVLARYPLLSSQWEGVF